MGAALSFALMWIACLAYTRERAPRDALATAQGLFTAVIAAGGVGGMLCFGALYRRHGGTLAFGAAAAVASLGALLALVWAARFGRGVGGRGARAIDDERADGGVP